MKADNDEYQNGESRPISDPANVDDPPIALFDFDGVLIHGDLFESFLRNRFRRQPWRLLPTLIVFPVLLLLRVVPLGRPLLTKLLVRLGLLGSRLARLEPELEHWGRKRARLPGVVIRDGVLALRRHVANGDRVIVITGCEQRLAHSLLDELALGDIEVIGSRLRDGWLGVRPLDHVIGRRKISALAEHGIPAPWSVAYSDSSLDTPMLKGAEQAILVNTDARSRKRIERRLGTKLTLVHWR